METYMSRKLEEIRGHRSRRWWLTGATLLAVAAFSVIFVAASSGMIGSSGFEGNDGNMVVGGNTTPPGNGTKDWANISPFSIQDGTGSTDDSIGSSKEDDPYPQIVTQSTPPKDDFTSVHLATEVIGTDVYLYQSSIRSAPNGSANENVELNQATTVGPNGSTTSPNGVTPWRTVGDRLITFDFGGGTAHITILKWNTSNSTPCADQNDSQPCWDSQTELTPTLAEGAVNDGNDGRTGAIAAGDNTLTGAALAVNQFQEMSVNLTGTGILPTTASGDCESFASTTIKSRSSGAAGTFNSDLKDIVFSKRSITNCGSIVVKKVTNPSPDTTDSFTFTGDAAGSIKDGGTITVPNVAPGTYSSTEAAAAGFDLTNISCDDANSATASSGNTGTRTATFKVDPGETVTCTFTNTKRGSIVVKKVTSPSPDATDSFTFTGDAAGSIKDGGTITVPNLVPGTYSSTEAAAAGFDLTNISCDDANSATASSGNTGTRTATFKLDPGETVTCTFTNTKKGSITVVKHTQGGDNTFAFTGSGTGVDSSFSIGTVAGTGNKAFTGLSAGSYSVSEGALPAGWSFTSLDCGGANGVTVSGKTATINLAAGQNVTCTYTNTKGSTITVKKLTDPSGDPTTFGFTGDITATLGDGQSADASVAPGTYHVTEGATAGWDLTDISCNSEGSSGVTSTGVATFVVGAGEHVTCTFTNSRQPTITVNKRLVPATDTGTFDFAIDDQTFNNGGDGYGNNGTTGAVSVSPGDHTISESGNGNTNVSDYASTWSCSTEQSGTGRSIDLSELGYGDNVTCTFTNTRLATLIVVKNVDNSNGGGSKGPGDFSIHVTAAGLELPGSPAAGSSSGSTYSGLMPGTYKVSEDAVSGYSLTGISGCLADGSVVLEAGATVTCTLTNTSAAPPPPPVTPPPTPPAPRIDLAITKTGTPNPVTVGSGITWTMIVTNNGPNGATGVTVADPVPAGTTFVSVSTSQGTCTGGAVVNCQLGSMAVGTSVTITLVTTAGTTGTLTNTATTVGNEQETNTANNTATASVVAKGVFVPPVKYCTAVSVAPKKTLFVGRKTTLTLKVTQNGKAVKGIRIKIKGALTVTTTPSNAKGLVKVTLKPKKAGIVTFAPASSTGCANPRIGVTGVFTPPVTG
jgi:uncharacterized repeat protein (TIGR01451 family)